MSGAPPDWQLRVQALRSAFGDLALAFYRERERIEREGGPRVSEKGPHEEFRPPMGVIEGVIGSLEAAVESGNVEGLEESFLVVVRAVHERRVLARGAGLPLNQGPHRALWAFIRTASSARNR